MVGVYVLDAAAIEIWCSRHGEGKQPSKEDPAS